MSVMSMPALPDCAACGCPVVLTADHDGAVEQCVGCGLAQRPVSRPVDRAEVRAQVREVKRRRRLLAPKCFGRLHSQCRVKTCECWCHKRVPDAAS